MATVYQKIAKEALIKWNGLSEEEAEKKVQTESIEELESQIYAKSSIKYAVKEIAKQLELSDEETLKFYESIFDSHIDYEFCMSLHNKAIDNNCVNPYRAGTSYKGYNSEKVIEILSAIHDGWVIDNSSEKTFNKKVDRQQLRQYAPLELIGWNEAKSVLLFLGPILESIGLPVIEGSVEMKYHWRVSEYLHANDINDREDLINLISQGRGYYAALPEELELRLMAYSQDISDQIIDNWNKNDQESRKYLLEDTPEAIRIRIEELEKKIRSLEYDDRVFIEENGVSHPNVDSEVYRLRKEISKLEEKEKKLIEKQKSR